jgi:hypothetical protein
MTYRVFWCRYIYNGAMQTGASTVCAESPRDAEKVVLSNFKFEKAMGFWDEVDRVVVRRVVPMGGM